MRKYWMILIVFMMIPSVLGVGFSSVSDVYNKLNFYTDCEGDTADASPNAVNPTATGTIKFGSASVASGTQACYFDGIGAEDDDYLTWDYTNNRIKEAINWTVCYALNYSRNDAEIDFMNKWGAGNLDGRWQTLSLGDGTNAFRFQSIADGGASKSIQPTIAYFFDGSTEYSSFCFVHNQTGTTFWNYLVYNGSAIGEATGTLTVDDDTNNIIFGRSAGGNYPVTSGVDDIMMVNDTMTFGAGSEIETLIWNYGNFNLITNVDSTAPTADSTSINDSLVRYDDDLQLSVTASDETELSSIWYANNMSGSWVNVSSINLSAGQTTVNYSVNITNTAVRDNTIGGIFTINDTSGNTVQSGVLTYNVENTPPPQSTITNTSERYENNITIGTSTSTDADGDTVYYVFYQNSTKVQNSTSTSYTTAVVDGYYNYSVSTTDLINVTGGVDWVFKLDSIPATYSDNVTNNTYLNHNMTYLFTSQSVDNYNLTVNLTDGSKTYEFYWDDTVTSGELSITANLNITGLASGNYSLIRQGVESHSDAIDLDKFNKQKNSETELTFIDTDDNKEISMIKMFYKDESQINTPINLVSYTDINEIGYITFGMNFTADEKETEIVFDMVSDYRIRTIDSGYKGHLMFDYDYGMDFEGVLLVNGLEVDYDVISTQISQNRVLVRVRPLKGLETDDVVEYRSETLFGINFQEITYNLIVDNTAPNITFVQQIPADLNVFDAFISGVKSVWNITDNVALDISTIKSYYKSNSSTSDTFIYINGTALTGFQEGEDSVRNNTINEWNFTHYDNTVLPATYNLDENTLENTAHSYYTLDSVQKFYSTRLYNVNQKNFTFIEIMLNCSGNARARVFYCNETYNFDVKPTDSSYCSVLGTVSGTDWNHTSTAYSSHKLLPMPINSTGYFNDVYVTPASYFIVEKFAGVGNCYQYYVTDTTRPDTTKYSSDGGLTYTNLTTTIDLHLHQFDGTDYYHYYVCANDTVGNTGCSEVRSDLFDLLGLPPNAPIVTAPTTGAYRGLLNTTVSGVPISPNGYDMQYFNITLYDQDLTFVSVLNTNNSLNLTYEIDTTGITDGTYYIRWEVTDSENQKSSGFSDNFSIDNTAPDARFIYPSNTSTTHTKDTVIRYSFNDTTSTDCTLKIDGSEYFSGNVMVSSYTNSTSFDFGTHNWIINCTDSASNNQYSSGYFNIVQLPSTGGGSTSVTTTVYGCGEEAESCSDTVSCCDGLSCVEGKCSKKELEEPITEPFAISQTKLDLSDLSSIWKYGIGIFAVFIIVVLVIGAGFLGVYIIKSR